jgi:hypothetical protein
MLTPQVLPRIMVDGPFGSASEDFTKFETILLVGGELTPPSITAYCRLAYRANPLTYVFLCSWNRRNPLRLDPQVYLVSRHLSEHQSMVPNPC